MRDYPTRAAVAVGVLLALTACKGAPDTNGVAAARATDEVIIDANSPKLAYIVTDTVTLRHEKTVAILPAQLVLNESRTVRVTSPVTGRAESVDVQPGDAVRRGAPLVRLVSGDFAQARSDLAKARAALDQTTAALRRNRDLFDHHIVAAKELEQAKSDEAQARAEAARADARVRGLGGESTDIVGTYVLRAPASGIVVNRAVSAGTEVRPDAASPLFVISAMDTLWLTASVYQRDLPSVRRGSRLDFTTDAVPNAHFLATVTYVSNTLDSTTHTATIRANLPNPGGVLRAQTVGEARLLAPSTTAVLVIPTTALVTHGTETVVFVELQRGHFGRRTVTVADDDGSSATISAGLHPGDRVVTAGSLLLAAEADRAR